MAEYQAILFEKEKGVAMLTLNQPENRNLMTEQMFKELMDAVEEVTGDDDTKVFVLTAAGDIFCGGWISGSTSWSL